LLWVRRKPFDASNFRSRRKYNSPIISLLAGKQLIYPLTN